MDSEKSTNAEDGGPSEPKTTRDELENEQKLRRALEVKVAAQEVELKDDYSKIGDLQTDNENLVRDLSEARGLASAASGDKKRLERDLRLANQENAKIQKELEKLRATRTERDQELAKNTDVIARLKEQVQGWRDEVKETEAAMRKVEDENSILASQQYTNERLQAEHVTQIEGLREDLHIVMQERNDLHAAFVVLEETLPIEHIGDLGPEDLREKLLDWMQERGTGGDGKLKPPHKRGASMEEELDEEDEDQGAEEGVNPLLATCPQCGYVGVINGPALPPVDNPFEDATPAPPLHPPATSDTTTNLLQPPRDSNGSLLPTATVDTTAGQVPPQAPAAAVAGNPPPPQAPQLPTAGTAGDPPPPQAPQAPAAGTADTAAGQLPPQAPAAAVAGNPPPPQAPQAPAAGTAGNPPRPQTNQAHAVATAGDRPLPQAFGQAFGVAVGGNLQPAPPPQAPPGAAPPGAPPNPGMAAQVPPRIPRWLVVLLIVLLLGYYEVYCCFWERYTWLNANETTRRTLLQMKDHSALFPGWASLQLWLFWFQQFFFPFERTMPG